MAELKLTLHHYRVLHQIRLGNITVEPGKGLDCPAGIGTDVLDNLHDLGLWSWKNRRACLTDQGVRQLEDAVQPDEYLTPSARPAGSVLGRTRNRYQALDAGTVLTDADALATAAHYRDQQRREKERQDRQRMRELLALEDRIKTLRTQAHMAGINISSEMRAIEQMKRYAGAPKIVTRLRAVERRVDERRVRKAA